MATRERQRRYKTTGAAAGLIKVETLIPPEDRATLLRLADQLRERHRRRQASAKEAPTASEAASASASAGERPQPGEMAATPAGVEAALARLRTLCQAAPRRYTASPDVASLVVTSVNIPFPRLIDAETLASALRTGELPSGWKGHLARFLGELPLVEILRFCDRHDIDATALANFLHKHGERLAVRRPDLEEHLDVLSPQP